MKAYQQECELLNVGFEIIEKVAGEAGFSYEALESLCCDNPSAAYLAKEIRRRFWLPDGQLRIRITRYNCGHKSEGGVDVSYPWFADMKHAEEEIRKLEARIRDGGEK